jgi:SNF2 family DNA or RNA helicase
MFLVVTKEGLRWVARFPWSVETKDLVKRAGFRFESATKLWWTDNPEIAARIWTPDALAAWLKQEKEAIADSRKTDADVDIPVPAGLSLLGYQKAGVAYALARPATLIGDEMGLGKTVQAIATCNASPTADNVLIICPASLKLNWASEWRKWDVKNLPVVVVGREWPGPDMFLHTTGATPGVVILNYEMVKKHRAEIDKVDWDLLICDEVHYMKSSKSQRKEFVLGRWNFKEQGWQTKPIQAKRRVFLTGTPIVNKPYELWPIVRSLDPNGLGRSWQYFTSRYCDAHSNGYGTSMGASNLDELQDRLRQSIMVRRLKKDVLKDLPPKRRTVVLLEPDFQKFNMLPTEDNFENVVRDLAKPGGVAFEEIARVRREVAVSKIPTVIDWVGEMLEEVDKLVVMAHHHDVIDGLATYFGKTSSAVIDGRTPLAERQANVERFQNDPTCRLFIGSIRAAGVGLTLTAASTVVFAELDWTPGNVSQAEDRCHRIGQHDMVNVYHLVLNGSIDAKMAKVIVDKQAVIDVALDQVSDKAIPTGPGPVPSMSPQEVLNRLRPQRPSNSPMGITVEQRKAVHECLRILAGMCDGAVKRDHCGFNGRDSGFGKSLAERTTLTDKQVMAATKMVRKYKRQLPPELLSAIANLGT